MYRTYMYCYWNLCINIAVLIFLQRKFKSVPTVLVSAEHERQGVKHDASSVWVEDLTTISFKICIRELQNFDGAHQSIHVVSNCPLFMGLGSFCVFCGFRQFYCKFVWPIETRI